MSLGGDRDDIGSRTAQQDLKQLQERTHATVRLGFTMAVIDLHFPQHQRQSGYRA